MPRHSSVSFDQSDNNLVRNINCRSQWPSAERSDSRVYGHCDRPVTRPGSPTDCDESLCDLESSKKAALARVGLLHQRTAKKWDIN